MFCAGCHCLRIPKLSGINGKEQVLDISGTYFNSSLKEHLRKKQEIASLKPSQKVLKDGYKLLGKNLGNHS